MRNRNDIFKMYISDFDSFKTAQEYINPNFITTEELIRESISKTRDRFISFIPEVVLNEEEELYVVNKIKSIHSIYQEEGDVILGDYDHDYDHDYDWFKNFLNR